MVIVRILDTEATSSRKKDKGRAKERARILHERNPCLPGPPKTLRGIRNDFEHFEKRLDVWATSSNQHIYIDLNMGELEGFIQIPGMEDQDVFRHLQGHNLTFWNKSVNLKEVIHWVNETSA